MRRLCSYSLLCALLLLTACSTKKNTSGTRFFHSMTARFNTMHNAQEAYQAAQEAQLKGHQDDYTELLPMFIETREATAKLGTSSMETAITKCEKAIHNHTIKKKPQAKSGKKLTPKEKAYRQRKEFNPYLWRSWLLMAKAQYGKGDFIEAASTFGYIAKLYQTQPEVSSVARAWMARCYVALAWPYDAEDVLDKLRRDSLTTTALRDAQATEAALHILQQQYPEAIAPLEATIKHTRNRQQKARLLYLEGQIYREIGDVGGAYRCFQKAAKSNPPYELEFNARIAMTEVASKGQAKKMISRLKRMAKNDKNKDYLDQVYYAIGNIYLSEGDSLRAAWAYEDGAEKSTKNGIAKAVVLLHLSELYWQMENYIDAARTYKECIGVLDKEHASYAEAERRATVLGEVEPHLSSIKLQDSLQALVRMPEAERLAAIDRTIEELKKKEKEEAKKAAQAENGAAQAAQATATQTATQGQKGAWYFYNPTAVASGKQEFQRKWGKRANVDYWRLTERPATEDSEETQQSEAEAEGDSLFSDMLVADSLRSDPHQREYYLAMLPFTPEAMEASNQIIADALYQAAIVMQDQVQNYPYALRLYARLQRDFPLRSDAEQADIYHHLFLLHGRLWHTDEAEDYRQKLINEYPTDRRAIVLSSPDYDLVARDGKHLEDTLYVKTYEAYMQSRYGDVARHYDYHTRNFPEGQHRARMMFVMAMSHLYRKETQAFLELMEEMTQKYGKEEITELASYIIKGVKEGRLLGSSKYDSSDIWKRRRYVGEAGDSVVVDSLVAERNTTFNFVLAYPSGSLNEDQLLYEVARYNFTAYMVRNFELELLDFDHLSMLCVKGFQSYDEVHFYAQQLYSDPDMALKLDGIRALLISDQNLNLLGKAFSFDDYAEFFEAEFRPMEVSKDLLLDEQTEIEVRDEDYEPPTEEPTANDTDDFPFGF